MASALTPRGSTRRWRMLRAHIANTTLPAPCPYCGQIIAPGDRFDLDHETPRVHGGGDARVRAAHPRCNRSAGSHIRARATSAPSRDW